MQALRVDALLPRFYNPDQLGRRKSIEPAKVQQTLDEIRSAFGGYTLNDLPITGSWLDPKTKKSMEDSHTSIWISVEKRPETINKLKQLKEEWKRRFEQEDIMMYYITIDTL